MLRQYWVFHCCVVFDVLLFKTVVNDLICRITRGNEIAYMIFCFYIGTTFELPLCQAACLSGLAWAKGAVLANVVPLNGNLLAPMTKNVIDTPSGPSSVKICRENPSSDRHRASIARLMTTEERRSDAWASASLKAVMKANPKSVSAESKCGKKF